MHLSLATLEYLVKRDHFTLNEKAIHETLQNISFTGRMDTKMINGKKVIIDGAHNPQKMKALTTSLRSLYPDTQFTFIVAFKKHKNYLQMLQYIVPLARHIIVTTFPENNGQISAENPTVIAGLLKQMQYSQIQIIPVLTDAVKEVSTKNAPVIVTGSLYLAGEMYRISE